MLQQPLKGLTEQVVVHTAAPTSTFSTAAAAAAAACAAASLAAASVAAASASSACSMAMPAATAAAELRRRQGALSWFKLVNGCRGNMPPLTCIVSNFELTLGIAAEMSQANVLWQEEHECRVHKLISPPHHTRATCNLGSRMQQCCAAASRVSHESHLALKDTCS